MPRSSSTTKRSSWKLHLMSPFPKYLLLSARTARITWRRLSGRTITGSRPTLRSLSSGRPLASRPTRNYRSCFPRKSNKFCVGKFKLKNNFNNDGQILLRHPSIYFDVPNAISKKHFLYFTVFSKKSKKSIIS